MNNESIRGDIMARGDYISMHEFTETVKELADQLKDENLFNELVEKRYETDKPKSFNNAFIALYRMNSSLKFTYDKYRMSKKLSSDAELVSQRIDIKNKSHDIIHYIEDLYNAYPSFMESKEADVNDVIRNITDIMNRIKFDESRYTVD